MPPVVEDSQGHTFIRGYLKRLNSQKPGAESEEKWVVRWIELERPLDRPGSSELLLSVYKSDAKLKRLNAVIFRRIKASVLSTVRAARVYNASSRKVGIFPHSILEQNFGRHQNGSFILVWQLYPLRPRINF